ncbi:DNA-binding response regulator [Niabella ginsenosidivorans]|uniref:DNA-binding response regulator n=1 Tax=Niabella ginsenosidivorans TaxID=1176587 RepID=A0A1A9HZF1_9BACT|nr:response regulator transcription factor [Niabella ginsenosidivorans]ANH80787.1 DNA-binding response regulator [Niabella ginsenosidivorans]
MLQHNQQLTIAIVDDHPIVIEGLKNLLASEKYFMIISFTTGRELQAYLKSGIADVILLDIVLPDINGLELCKDIKKKRPETVILAISNQTERSMIVQMLQNGASGYLLKNASADELLDCIERGMKGEPALCNGARAIMSRPSPNDWEGIPSLTKREKEILKLIADGFSSTDIADKLFLSQLTVETHRKNIIQKFQTNNMFSVIKLAMEHKMI